MKKHLKRILSMVLCITMLTGIMPTSALGLENVTAIGESSVQQLDSGLPKENTEEPPKTPEEKPLDTEEPIHWIQQYQDRVLGQMNTRSLARAATPTYTLITWGSTEADTLHFANGAYLKSPLPKIYLNGEIAFCGQWNGQNPGGSYEQIGNGSDTVIKQILANYDKSAKTNADYAAAQVAIWARLMGTSVTTWGGCPGASSANAIMNGTNDYSNLKYNYLQWSGGTQDLITYNKVDGEVDPPDPPEPPEYPEDKYRI